MVRKSCLVDEADAWWHPSNRPDATLGRYGLVAFQEITSSDPLCSQPPWPASSVRDLFGVPDCDLLRAQVTSNWDIKRSL